MSLTKYVNFVLALDFMCGEPTHPEAKVKRYSVLSQPYLCLGVLFEIYDVIFWHGVREQR
jgi:hypothetical protein